MSQYTFVGIWYFLVPATQTSNKLLAPYQQDGYFPLFRYGSGNGNAPWNCYNVYSTPNPGEYIFQSQLNGMYVGMPAELGWVCAQFADPAQAQPLIPTPYQNVTILYLPDKVHFLGEGDDESGSVWVWQTDKGSNYLYNHAGLQPTSWSFSNILAGKGSGNFTLHYANLTDCVFPPGTDLTFIDFSGAVLDGATLDHCKLNIVNFSNCSLKKASLRNAICVHTAFDKANLTGAHLDGATISSGDFSNCDLTSVTSDDTMVVSAESEPVHFYGAKLNFALIGHNWQWMDLRNATIYQLPGPLSSSTTQLQATGAKLSGLNQNSLKGVTLEHAVLDYSLLDGLDLSGADLTGASLIDASLHGATLTNTKLPGANLSGSQLGSLGHLFTLPSSAEAALNGGQVSVLAPYFEQNGITLSSNVTIETLAANRVWQLTDTGNHVAYTIRLETQSGNTQVLTVYAPVLAASLVNAYLPNATLTGTNLYGALANGIQFYGSNARIDGSAILEAAQLNNSNFSNLNLTQAELLGANLSGSYLFNAKFNKANLTPSADGVAANLSDANLQGADFTDAQLYGANLSNAAVAVNVPTTAVPHQGGVYLFSLPYAGDTNTLQQYTGELNVAASKFSLNPEGDQAKLQQYVSALKANDLAPLKPAFLKHQPPIVLSNNAQIQTVEVDDIWQIVDGAQSYTLWTEPDENGKTELYAAPSLTKTQTAFHQNNMTLRWQASAAIDKANQQWLLDNDSENPQNFSTGYVKFIVQLNGSVLDVYGTAVRIERLGDNKQLQMDTETCNLTVVTVTNMNSETICPNGTKLSTNQNTGGVQWDTKWLRATSPPKPPSCVPTDYIWCPQTQTTNKPPNGGRQRNEND